MQSGDDLARGKSAQQIVQVEDRNQRQSHVDLGTGHMWTWRRRSTEHASPMLCIESINGAMSKHHAPGNVR